MLRLPYISLALLSASALAYELLLMRLFSIIHWHHFAYMVIALALLGHGISGSIVMLLQRRLIKSYQRVYILCIVCFGIFSITSFLLAQQIPFNAEEIIWDWRQKWYLLSIFLILSLPFFFVGAAICLSFLYFKERLNKLYAADLLGAGLGCLSFVLILQLLFADSFLLVIACTASVLALVAAIELKCLNLGYVMVLTLVLLTVYGSGWQPALNISPYKSLSQLLRIKGTKVITEKSSPLGQISVLASDQIPLRHAPGMSMSSGTEPLPQLGVFTDADNMTTITSKPEHKSQLLYLDQMTSALAYHLFPPERLLIIGTGTGNDILQARFHQVKHIDAVEINPQLVELTGLQYGDFISDVYRLPGVKVFIADGRDYIEETSRQYDQIQLSLLDSFSASTAGLYALNESYLYTVEAIQGYLSALKPGGYISITRWLKMPPRDSLKLFNISLTALKQNGAKQATRQVILIRSWQTSTLIIKNGVFSGQEIAAAEKFSRQRLFDLVYTPEIKTDQVNRFNVLKTPLFYQATQALAAENKEQFIEDYKFNLQTATDDKPYFQHFFRWASLPEMLSLLRKGGASLIETGYLIIFATLCIALICSVVLIVLPLYFFRQKQKNQVVVIYRRNVFAYFFIIGLSFLMIEIAFMQKFILFLHHPQYSAAAMLTAFLVFAGMGSACSSYLRERYGLVSGIRWVVSAIVLLSLLYLWLLPMIFIWGSHLSMLFKFLLAIFLVAPLAFCMGIPMPLALNSLADHAEYLIAWAWSINACASVISSVLSTLLAMQFGFSNVIVLALLLYGFCVFMFPSASSQQTEKSGYAK